MLLNIEEVKDYLRIDYEDEDQFLTLLINNSESYLKDAVDDFETKLYFDELTKNKPFRNKAKLVMLTLITNWYDTRDYTELNVSEKVRYTISSLIKQMNFSYVGEANE